MTYTKDEVFNTNVGTFEAISSKLCMEKKQASINGGTIYYCTTNDLKPTSCCQIQNFYHMGIDDFHFEQQQQYCFSLFSEVTYIKFAIHMNYMCALYS